MCVCVCVRVFVRVLSCIYIVCKTFVKVFQILKVIKILLSVYEELPVAKEEVVIMQNNRYVKLMLTCKTGAYDLLLTHSSRVPTVRRVPIPSWLLPSQLVPLQ